MMITLTQQDFAALSPGTRTEVLALLGQAESTKAMKAEPSAVTSEEYKGIDMEDVVDLSLKQVQAWMEAASDKTKLGLRVIAEHGPVIRAEDLTSVGIDNLAHFQSRTTIRTRTVTRNKNAYLLGFDDWSEAEEGKGRYAVTPTTLRSLRSYFQLD